MVWVVSCTAHVSHAAVLSGLLDLLLPPACLACGTRTPGPDVLLCPACAALLDEADADALRAELLPGGALDDARARFRYRPDGPLAPILHALKYGQRPRYGRLLGQSLAALELADADALVPLPLHRARFLDRGYNQSKEIARGLAEATGWPVRPDLLARAVFTDTQTKRDRTARAANVAHAFVAAPDAAGMRLWIVDDVVTTGATARAAADALKAAGATWVGVAAAAWTS